MKTRMAIIVTLALVAILNSGCASFQKNMLPRVPSSQIAGSGTTATYTFANRAEIAGPAYKPTPINSPLVSSFVSSMKESGIDCYPEGGYQNADLNIDVKHTWYGGNWAHPLWAFVTGYSLFTIPCWQPQDHSIQFMVRQPGKEEKIYNFRDGSTTVMWLPMLLAAPFTYSNNQKNPVLPNIYRNFALSLKQDGFLRDSQNSNSVQSPAQPQQTMPSPSAQSESAADKIKALEKLFKDGLITQEEYDAKRKRLLSEL